MSMLQTHEEALESTNIVYHEFLLIYKKNKEIVYGVIEGKDDPSFYRGLIQNSLPPNWDVKLIKAGNKIKVLKAHEAFDWHRFSKKQICFFVDRDLSDFLNDLSVNDENIYVTDGYSIENEILNHSTLERVLEEVLNITDISSDELATIIDLYEKGKEQFVEKIAPVMAQVIIWQRGGERPCLGNINMSELFDFQEGAISVKQAYKETADRLRYAAEKCNLNTVDAELQADCEKEFYDKGSLSKYIRGKYMLWYFVQFALSVHESITYYCAKYNVKPKAKVSLGEKNALAIIGPRVRIPKSLYEFIGSTYLPYIRDIAAAA